MTLLIQLLLLLASYLVGAIPFGLVIGKLKGIDIRQHGSKNIGTTNTGRVLGKKYAIYTFILDTLKGSLFVFLFRFEILSMEYCLLHPLLYGFAAVLGHTFSIYIKFSGGKAVATSGGVILAYSPTVFLASFFIFLLVTYSTKFVSLGSMIGATIAFILSFVFFFLKYDPIIPTLSYDIAFPILALIMLIIIVIRHKANIKRLRNKTESKVKW